MKAASVCRRSGANVVVNEKDGVEVLGIRSVR